MDLIINKECHNCIYDYVKLSDLFMSFKVWGNHVRIKSDEFLHAIYKFSVLALWVCCMTFLLLFVHFQKYFRKHCTFLYAKIPQSISQNQSIS